MKQVTYINLLMNGARVYLPVTSLLQGHSCVYWRAPFINNYAPDHCT
jgi:hypothetical protein